MKVFLEFYITHPHLYLDGHRELHNRDYSGLRRPVWPTAQLLKIINWIHIEDQSHVQ